MQKKRTYRNEDYLRFIRRQICLVEGNDYNVVAHHVRLGQNGGMGLKPSDYRTIPLFTRRHIELHNTGERSFYKKYGIDEKLAIICCLTSYICHKLPTTNKTIELLEKLIEDCKD